MNMIEELRQNYDKIKDNIRLTAEKTGRNPDDVSIIAVSKMHDKEIIKAGIEAGIPILGENYVQEMKEKYDYILSLNMKHPRWHFIGHLQTNKIKYIASFVDMIHSVDSVHLAEFIDKEAKKNNRTIDILLQVNTSGEDSKSGCEPEEVFHLADLTRHFANLKIRGLMTIGSFSYDEELVRSEFVMLRNLRDELKQKFPDIDFKELSMGMSGDYMLAVEEGATMVRVGTSIFGLRNYNK